MDSRLPTIPEYYKRFINKNVDLVSEPKQCCPFHKEDTPSFSYSADRGRWRCFGACKIGGDVISLHQRHYGLRNRAEAEKSLKSIYGITEKVELRRLDAITLLNERKIDNESIYQECLLYANCPERWIELDYVMSMTPVDYNQLKLLLMRWKGV